MIPFLMLCIGLIIIFASVCLAFEETKDNKEQAVIINIEAQKEKDSEIDENYLKEFRKDIIKECLNDTKNMISINK